MTVSAFLVRLRHPQTTVRWRLTLLYGGLFLVCGAALLAITYTLVSHAATAQAPRAQFRHIGPLPQLALRPRQVPLLAGPVRKVLASKTGQAAVRIVIAGQRGADLNQLEEESGIALAIMAIISGLLGWLVAGRVLRPLRTMTAAAQDISEANLHRRLAMPGPRDELRQLADTIDGLLARLEGAFDAQRRFVANASHELRTPLTSARALLEMVISNPDATVESFRAACREMLEENEYQEQLIDALLTLAQGQRGLDRHLVVDLGRIVETVVAAHQLDAAASAIGLETSVDLAVVAGDPRLLERLVSNLLENGIRHNTSSGWVDVSVRGGSEGTLLKVANTGPVVPAEQVERLVQPFQRLSQDRVGHGDGLGLGLSIVAAIAAAHDASLDVQPRRGGGLVVVVRFPSGVWRLDELVLEDVPEQVAREGVDELNPAGSLESGQLLSPELEQPLG